MLTSGGGGIGVGLKYSKRAVIPEVVVRRGVCSKLVLVYVEFIVDSWEEIDRLCDLWDVQLSKLVVARSKSAKRLSD